MYGYEEQELIALIDECIQQGLDELLYEAVEQLRNDAGEEQEG